MILFITSFYHQNVYTFQAFTKQPPPQCLEDVWHLFHNQQAHQTCASKMRINIEEGIRNEYPSNEGQILHRH